MAEPQTPDDVMMQPETLKERIKADGEMFAAGVKFMEDRQSNALNPEVVLAALDSMLEPFTLHQRAEASVLRVRIKKLRDHVAQYVVVSDAV